MDNSAGRVGASGLRAGRRHGARDPRRRPARDRHVGGQQARRQAQARDIEARHREALYAALAAGITYAKNKIAAASEGRSALNIQNDLARFAAQYAVSKVPDAVRHFELSPERVQELVRARLPS